MDIYTNYQISANNKDMSLINKHKYEPVFQSDASFEYERDLFDQFLHSSSKFTDALNTLQQTYHPSQIKCRDEETRQIQSFLEDSIAAGGSSQSLYISGVPGIGKTLCAKKVAIRVCEQKKDQVLYIYTNALTIKRPIEIFKVIYYEMTKKMAEPASAIIALNDYFEKGKFITDMSAQNNRKKKVLIIDEIDFLSIKDEEILYNIFQWTQKKRSQLIIIAISNTLDFPQSLPQKLCSRIGNKRLLFKPYTSGQIQIILKERIGNLNVFEEQAITYICKKVAQCSSDVRKSLQILREAINDHLLQEHIKQNKQKKTKSHKKNYDFEQSKIDLDCLAKAHDKIYRDCFVALFCDFPNSYKIVLYCLAKYFKVQTRSCTMRQLESLLGSFHKTPSQLRPILIDLRDLGIITIKFFTSPSVKLTYLKFKNLGCLNQQHITLLVDYDRIYYALQKEDLQLIDFNINLNI